MSGNDEQGDMGRIEIPLPQGPRNPLEGFLRPQLPEQVGEVDIDEKTKEVLLGLNNKLLRALAQIMITPDRKPPDTTALWNEALGHLAAQARFIRDAEGKFHLEGIQYEEFLTQAEPLFVNLRNWAGIFSAMGEALNLGALLIASLHGDVANHLGRDDLKTLVPEDQLQMFRIEYEAKNLESMKGVFATEPQQGERPAQGFV